jgi:hypothetical protein
VKACMHRAPGGTAAWIRAREVALRGLGHAGGAIRGRDCASSVRSRRIT